ncbi:ChrR family anti-sigma-E factor [Terricaulis sp.]|uniref:ChrR family anti-sigma-E factor n=1 Tax=Terricaulis sp. TaxID=2768686 RepID=UPI0037836235
MIPRHHPAADILASYAAGALEPGFGLVVGAHLEGCTQCRGAVRAFEATSGEALSGLDDVAVGDDALSRVMARIDETHTPVTADARPLLQRLQLKKKNWVAPGVWAAAVDTPHAPENRVYVLRIGAGLPAARHQHSGAEFCTVLKGAYRDELGLFSAGDFAAVEGDFSHRPKVEPYQECICLFASEGRLKAVDAIGRLAFRLANV